MFDLSTRKIDVECSSCKRKHTVTFSDVMNEKLIHCSCGTGMQLCDSNGSVKKGVQGVNAAMKELNDTFRSLGK